MSAKNTWSEFRVRSSLPVTPLPARTASIAALRASSKVGSSQPLNVCSQCFVLCALDDCRQRFLSGLHGISGKQRFHRVCPLQLDVDQNLVNPI